MKSLETLTFNKENWTGEVGTLEVYEDRIVIPELEVELSYSVEDIEDSELIEETRYVYYLEDQRIVQWTSKGDNDAHISVAQKLFNTL